MSTESESISFQCLDFIARDEYILEKTETDVKVGYEDYAGSDEEQKQPVKKYKKWNKPSEPSIDDEQKGFQILLFGTSEKGQSVCVEVTGYRPYFYVQIPMDWPQKSINGYKSYLLKKCVYPSPDAIKLITFTEERHKKLFDFDNGELHRFLKITVPSQAIWRRFKNAMLTENLDPVPILIGGETLQLKVYEANIDPVLRFFHERNLDPAGWIKLPAFKYELTESEDATTKITASCEWRFIEKDTTKMALAPTLIGAWDIECMSSHGDFPQAIKTYRKPARELLEADITTVEDAAAALAEAFNAGQEHRPSKSKLSPIYIKGRRSAGFTAEDILKEITEQEEFEDLLTDEKQKMDKRISDLDVFLNEKMRLPPIRGDELIQIGIVLYRNKQPESKHIFVLDSCDRDKVAPPSMRSVPVHVYVFDTEKKLITAFHKWLGETDTDIMITYNGFGFDEQYLWNRAQELDCVSSCSSWSRLSTGKPKLLEKFLSSAAMGDNFMYIINSPGRLKIDLLPYVRRNYNLDSYTLDNVSATFMSGGIKGQVETINEDMFRVHTKSTKGAIVGRFIVLMDEENEHVLDKAEITAVEGNSLIIRSPGGSKKLAEHGFPPTKWAQVKDDVSPKELFALQRGTSADRAKIARYCLQDCDLVMELFMKLDVLNNSVAMANVCSVPVSFIFMRGQGVKIESLIFKECRLEDQLIEVLPAPKNGFSHSEPKEPPPPDSDDETEKPPEEGGYEGAFVLEPHTGIYLDGDPVGVPDFSSLYPSAIISENLCHSSVVWVKDTKLDGTVVTVEGSDKYDNLPGIGYIDIDYDILIYDPNDKRKHPAKIKAGTRCARFAQLPDNKKSTIPKILMKLLSSRKATRKLAEKETDEFVKALLDAQQLAYKLTANSLYGQLGSGTSKIRRVVLAASTTAYGRKQLIFAKELIEQVYGGGKDPRCDAKAIYGDTDSLFIRWLPKNSETGERLRGDEAVAMGKELTEEAGQLVSYYLKDPHDFEFDKVFKTFCLLSKKRYVGDMSEGDLDCFYRKAMGIVMKRRDNAPIVKTVYGGVIENILVKQDIRAAFDFVQKSCLDLVAGKFPISKLTITKSLRAEYKTPNPPAHKILAERIGQRDPGNKPSSSERIPYIYIPAPPGSTLQGDRIETPTFIRENKITPDYAFYITNQIAKPVAQVFGLVVEQLPGIKKSDLDLIFKSAKKTETREKIAEHLLFGKILDTISKERTKKSGQMLMTDFAKKK